MLATAYVRQLKALLPRGLLFFREANSGLSKLLSGIADELARVDGRATDLIEEFDPRTATETLDDWERFLGLPDEDITSIPGTDEERRLAITAKLIRRGGQTPAYFIGLAAACGYTVTISDAVAGDVFRAGTARAGDLLYGITWVHTWVMTVAAPSGAALSHAELEAVIRRAAPSHSIVEFVYL